MSWFYHPYPLGEEAAPFVAAPVRVTLANRANRQGAWDTRRVARYKLGAPRVVVTPVVPPIQGYLTPTRDRNPVITRSKLYPPTVVNPRAAPFVASPVKVVLAEQLLRITRKRAQHRLSPPVVVYVIPLNFGPGVRLAPQTRGTPKSILRPPAVVTPERTDIFFGPKVTAARIRPAAVHSRLGPPTVVAPVLARPIRVTLVRIRPQPTDASVFKPAVVNAANGQQGGIGIQLAPSFRGKPKSKLSPPVVATAAVAFYGPNVTLARIRPPRTVARLLPVPAAFRPVGQLAVNLAYSSRGKAKSLLSGPAVIGGGIAYGGPRVKLTNPRDRNPAVRSRLEPPTVTAVSEAFYGPKVTLTKIRPRRTLALLLTVPDAFRPVGQLVVHLAADSPRGKAKPKLKAPAVVAPVLARPILVHLAYSRRGVPKSRLNAPTVVQTFRIPVVSVTLAPSSRGVPKSILRKPVDLVDQADVGYLRVHLAYSLRGRPKSKLRLPTVVAPVLARPVVTKLVRIRPVATRYLLRAPVVVRTAVELSGPEVTLVRIRPPRTTWLLRAPVAGAAQLKAEYDLRVTLAYQSRGRPKSKLRTPVVVTAATPYFRREPTALVRIRPRRTLWLLRKPVVAAVAALARPTLVSLVPSTRGRPHSVLRPPALLPALARPTTTLLAYSRRGTPHSVLRAPTVVAPFVARPTLVHLAPSTRGTPRSFLTPPSVVGAGIAFYGPRVTLVRIRPVPTLARLQVVIGIVPPCFGIATGSTRPTAENEISTEASAENRISTEAGASAAGITAAGSTMEGSTRPSAENDISDAQREGC